MNRKITGFLNYTLRLTWLKIQYPDPDENEPQLNVRDVQLNLDYNAYRKFLNKKVVVTGELTQGFTVHHKTAVLIDVREIQSAE